MTTLDISILINFIFYYFLFLFWYYNFIMIILVGPSASGKTEVAKILTSKFNFKKFVTSTTRPPRKGEINGLDYFFLTEDTFIKKKNNNEFIEYTFYNGNYYGTEKKLIDDYTVLIVESSGLKAFKNSPIKNIYSYFLICSESKRIERMKNRGDSEEMIKQRLHHDNFKFDDSLDPFIDKKIIEADKTALEIAEEIYQDYIKRIN